ncbi:MAG: hypothetical protein NT040_03395 [Bacteroidetes bacterium]|nr:hypothetical protein [Bacteroidota bacterium]
MEVRQPVQGMIHCGKKSPVVLSGLTFLFLFFFLWIPLQLTSQSNLPDTITTLWNRYENATDDSARVTYLSALAFFYNDFIEDKEKSDSLAEAAITLARRSHRQGLLLSAYCSYAESTDNERFYNKAVVYANKALLKYRIAHNLPMQWRVYRNLAKLHLSKLDFKNALTVSNEALMIAKTIDNKNLIAQSYLNIGSSYEFMNQKIDAFRNYLNAVNIAGEAMDPLLLRKCYSQFSAFYRDAMMYDEAIDYKQKEGKIILGEHPVDSVALMWAQCDLHLVSLRYQNNSLNEDSVKKIIDFTIRTRNNRMKDFAFALYRAHLLKSEQVDILYRLYKKIYPGEFLNLYATDPEMYYRLSAYFAEFEKKPDSALRYFKKAEQLVMTAPGKRHLYQSNFYNRYGQFLIRQGRKKEAVEKFTRSYTIGESDVLFGRFEFMLTACSQLEKLYQEAGDYKNAWFYASAHLRINDSISIISKKDQLMTGAVKRERSQKEEAAAKDREKIRQGKNERNMMAGGVVFLFIIFILAYWNFRKQKSLNRLLDAARKRSETLLLNILPHETAEELKTTGKAKAKRFDEVTVMFTDFKDFTQASERMSAEKLVDEINFYFTEFDHIISRYNIEKIKIIGDSYMCAGGLPVANDTHAWDVVRAAMDFQEFMITQKEKRSNLGESYFELRIGIHTGPVVAGIVGLKKFAYDIWGDTVNTASRMENSGVPNKVNISGETYEKVKPHFRCTYRGKVQAKHKGEIDMYFVDAGIS